MENEGYGSVIGNTSASYQNSLAAKYALAANYFGVAHPSLPNYLALIGGSTFGVTSDCSPAQCSLPKSTTTITTLFDSHGLSWKEYAESMPANCSQVNSPDGLYVTKQKALEYFGGVTGDVVAGITALY
jgi:acid phosphatase